MEKYIFKLILMTRRFREYGATWMLLHTGGRLTINLRATFQHAACPTNSVLKTPQVCILNLLKRMHSSRMRTGRTLTVFRCLVRGGGVSPKKAEIKKKNSPPKNWAVPFNPPPQPPNHPPQPPPPEKLETPR